MANRAWMVLGIKADHPSGYGKPLEILSDQHALAIPQLSRRSDDCLADT
jgi:hypothetical protein